MKLIKTISKNIGWQKKRRRTLEKISLLTLLLLIYLVVNTLNNFLPTKTKMVKKTKTTMEVFGAVKGKNRVIVMIFL